jgi:hypothetical protein
VNILLRCPEFGKDKEIKLIREERKKDKKESD